jgi:hypothetical protein
MDLKMKGSACTDSAEAHKKKYTGAGRRDKMNACKAMTKLRTGQTYSLLLGDAFHLRRSGTRELNSAFMVREENIWKSTLKAGSSYSCNYAKIRRTGPKNGHEFRMARV